VWEKFIYLAPMAAFTAASRLPIGPVWGDEFIREMFLSAVDEVERVAHASGIPVAEGQRNRITAYTANVPKTMRSSLLIDLSQGKKIEVEALQGSVVRRGAKAGVPTPIMSALYAVLKPYANGPNVPGMPSGG
jgi:2-dehydropantoate 2-reductase